MASDSGLLARLRAKLERHEFVKHVLTLLTGTASAQVLQILALIVVGRLYSENQVAVWSMVMAAVMVISPVAAGRYDMAIVLPQHDNDARQLLRLCTWINTVVCLLVVLGMFFLAPWAADLLTMNAKPSERPVLRAELMNWLYAVGPMAWLFTQLTTLSYWLTRTKNFRVVAENKIHQAVSVSGFQIGGGLAHIGVTGLVGGTVAGYLVSLVNLLRRTRGQYRMDEGPVKTKGQLAHEFIKMPALNGPNALVDAVRVNGIMFMIPAWFALAAAAHFSMAWRLLHAPMALINAAVAQVFYQRLSTVKRGGMLRIVRQAIVRSAVLGSIPFALIWLLGPWALPFALGAKWAPAGEIARVLVPWLFLNFITSPISTVFVVVRRQFTMLLFAIVYMAVPLTTIALVHDDILQTLTLVSWGMFGALVLFLGLALLVSWQYDRGFGERVDEGADR